VSQTRKNDDVASSNRFVSFYLLETGLPNWKVFTVFIKAHHRGKLNVKESFFAVCAICDSIVLIGKRSDWGAVIDRMKISCKAFDAIKATIIFSIILHFPLTNYR
jgi:hypothetical protein